MPKKKPSKPKETSITRSSAAEYLTFVAAGGESEGSIRMRYEDENIWLTQKMMASLYDVSIPAINQHLKRVFANNELEAAAVVKHYLIALMGNLGEIAPVPRLSGSLGCKIEKRQVSASAP